MALPEGLELASGLEVLGGIEAELQHEGAGVGNAAEGTISICLW